MTTPSWHLYLRNNQLEMVAEIDLYEMDAVLRHDAISTADVTVLWSQAAASLIDWGWGFVLACDGQTVFSGPITAMVDTYDQLTLKCTDDTVNLEDRVVAPTPAGPPYPDEFDIQTGAASTVMRHFVDANAGPSAIAPRRFPKLALAADPLIGPAVTWQGRFDNLQELTRAIALSAGDLGFRIIQPLPDDDQLEFQVYQSVDRTGDVVFSVEDGSLVSYEYTEQASTQNHLYAGGPGMRADRTIYEGESPPAVVHIGRRIERFINRPVDTSAAELQLAIDGALEAGAEVQQLRLTPAQDGTYVFGRDYGLGDLVTVVTRRRGDVVGIIREAKLQIRDGQAITIQPTIGTPGVNGDEAEGVAQAIGTLQTRVSMIERAGTVIPNGKVIKPMLEAAVQTNIDVAGRLVGEVRAGAFALGDPDALAQGWMFCNGAAISRSTYATLFAKLGTNYGAGNGTTTFNLPDWRGRVLLGENSTAGATHPIGSSGGQEAINLQHGHTYGGGAVATLGVAEAGSAAGLDLDTSVNLSHAGADKVARQLHTHKYSGTTDNAMTIAQNILPPFQAATFIIWTGVIP